jgi:hypothetical protein
MKEVLGRRLRGRDLPAGFGAEQVDVTPRNLEWRVAAPGATLVRTPRAAAEAPRQRGDHYRRRDEV